MHIPKSEVGPDLEDRRSSFELEAHGFAEIEPNRIVFTDYSPTLGKFSPGFQLEDAPMWCNVV